MGLNLTDSNESRSTHLYLPSSPHYIFQKYVVNIVQHMKRFVITVFFIYVCICIAETGNMNLIRPRNGYTDIRA